MSSRGCARCCADQGYRSDLMVYAICLNAIYLAVGAGVFLWVFRIARRRGLLLHTGE